MTTLIERIAKAICEASGSYWFEPTDDDMVHDYLNNRWRHQARAALEAMKEPTDAMIGSVENNPEYDYGYEGFAHPECTWPAMIDAALNEEQGT